MRLINKVKEKMIDYETYIKEEYFKLKKLRLSLNLKRLPRRRPRDPDEEIVLMILARQRWQKELEEGKLQEISPKEYIILG